MIQNHIADVLCAKGILEDRAVSGRLNHVGDLLDNLPAAGIVTAMEDRQFLALQGIRIVSLVVGILSGDDEGIAVLVGHVLNQLLDIGDSGLSFLGAQRPSHEIVLNINQD